MAPQGHTGPFSPMRRPRPTYLSRLQATDQLGFDLDLTRDVGLYGLQPLEDPVSQVSLEDLVAKYLPTVPLNPLPQETVPKLAKDRAALRALDRAIRQVPTEHRVLCRDARDLPIIPD